jgi:hypothetical protein
MKFSIIIITRGRYNRPFSGRRAERTQLGLYPPICELKITSNFAEVKYAWRYIPAAPYVFKAYCILKHRSNSAE